MAFGLKMVFKHLHLHAKLAQLRFDRLSICTTFSIPGFEQLTLAALLTLLFQLLSEAGNVKVINRSNLISKLQALEYIEGLNMARKAQGFFRMVNIIPGPIGMFRKWAKQFYTVPRAEDAAA